MRSSDLLKSARKMRHLSQRELADLARVPQSVVARYETGGAVPSLEQIDRLVSSAGLALRVELEPLKPPARRTHRLHELRSLAYHRLVADRLAGDTELLERARLRVARWLSGEQPFAGSRSYAIAWSRLLRQPADVIREAIVRDDPAMRAMRQNSPFSGLLGQEAWNDIVRSVREPALP